MLGATCQNVPGREERVGVAELPAARLRAWLRRSSQRAEEALGIAPLMASRDFEAWAHGSLRRNTAIVCLFILLSGLALWPLDSLYRADPEIVAGLALWRSGGVATALLALGGLLLWPRSRLVAHLCPAAALLLMGASSALVVSGFGDLREPWFYPSYLMGMMIVPLTVTLPWRVLLGLLQHGSFFAVYFGLHPEYLDHPHAAQPVQIFWFSAVGTGLVGHVLYRMVRRDFASRTQLAIRASELEELDRVKNEFFANVSHELRTPLTIILGDLRRVAAEGPKDLSVSAGLRATERLITLIDQLLLLARSSAGQEPPRVRVVDVGALLTDVVATFRSSQPEELTLEIAEPAEVFAVRGAPNQLRTVLFNLLSNAVKFTDPRKRRIRVHLWGDAEKLRIAVTDNGCGIAPERQVRIFERFYRAPEVTAQAVAGTGIGLSLVREILTAHGGEVSVTSELGKGSRFDLWLPRVPGEALGEGQHEPSEPLRVVEPAEPPQEADLLAEVVDADARVLVVDDDPDLRRYLVRQVQAAGYAALEAENGAAALAKIRQAPPDLLLTDVMMPTMSGYQLALEVRKTPELERLPILFLTARGGEQAREEAYQAGADDYLSKPFHESELRARLGNLLKLRENERRLAEQNRDLDAKVAARTREVEARTTELSNLARHLQTSREDERARLARELHDEMGQLLTGLRLELDMLRSTLGTEARAPSSALTRLDDLVDQALAQTRWLVSELRPRILDDLGLLAAMRWYTETFSGRTGTSVQLSVEGEPAALPLAVTSALFRILQEALTNVARHAEATTVNVGLYSERSSLRLVVEDDGVGIAPQPSRPGHFGLVSMRERAAAIGGKLRVERREIGGTRVEVALEASRLERGSA